MGRLVLLPADFREWMPAVLVAWDDHLDPLHPLTVHLATSKPAGGDPDAVAHIVLVQNAQPHCFSTLVDVLDHALDPWHPRLMCFTIVSQRPHAHLTELIDVDHRCDQAGHPDRCRSWWGDNDITDVGPVDLAHAAAVLIVDTERGLRWGGFATAACPHAQTAPRAEATGLLLAALWCRQLLALHAGIFIPVEFAFDCQHVAGVACGQMGSQCNEDLAIPLRAIIHWLEALNVTKFEWTHLSGHKGHPWNEAADTLCSHARRHGTTVKDMEAYLHQCTFDMQDYSAVTWLWLLEQSLHGHSDAPLLQGHCWKFNIAPPLTQKPNLDLQPVVWRQDVQQNGPREQVHLRLQLGTANVLTLFPGQDYASGYFSARAEGLAHQFVQAGLHIVGLQETRSRCDGHTRFQDFHVISAPATQRGVGGVQLWVRHRIHDGEVQLSVEPTHLYVLHASSHRLLVRFQCGGLRLLLMVIHAPVSDEDSVLEAFWRATTNAIPSRYKAWPLYVLADANARLGSVVSSAVDSHQPAEENIKGEHFHRWLIEQAMAVPQTWEACHSGEAATWTHATGSTARLDYIACPQETVPHMISTWVDDTIDLAILRDDHACVRAQVHATFFAQSRTQRRVRPLPRDLTWPTWTTDVHTHAAVFQQWLRAHQDRPRLVRKKHLSDETLKMISAKSHHRRRLAALRRHRRQALLRQMFSSWRSGQWCCDQFGPWLRECDRLEAWHVSVYYDLAPRIVKAVRQDGTEFYDGLAAAAGSASLSGARQLWSALKPVLPRWRAKHRSNLRCTGPAMEEKLDHYNQLEAGSPIQYAELLAQCCLTQAQSMLDAPVQVPLCDLPSRVHIEAILARLKPNKAPGLDEVSPATLKTYATVFSADLAKLFMKMWITGAEPLQFKGGLLHTIAKKQRSADIKHMRGIALLDGIAKVSHAVLRSQFVPTLEKQRAPLQLGGFAHQTTLFATHYLRAFAHLTTHHHMSASVIFVDIKSAFHALVRALPRGRFLRVFVMIVEMRGDLAEMGISA
eukprot:s2036_g14.t1